MDSNDWSSTERYAVEEMDEKPDLIVKYGVEIDERRDTPVENRSPCPRCGSKERNIIASVHLEAKFYEGIRARSFPPIQEDLTILLQNDP